MPIIIGKTTMRYFNMYKKIADAIILPLDDLSLPILKIKLLIGLPNSTATNG
ncbi:hypothetical protein FACS1894166_07690 [Bacilli bacterium]|nr:hypothetical protein FACS1894166_07690 [Bacilli bacterium]